MIDVTGIFPHKFRCQLLIFNLYQLISLACRPTFDVYSIVFHTIPVYSLVNALTVWPKYNHSLALQTFFEERFGVLVVPPLSVVKIIHDLFKNPKAPRGKQKYLVHMYNGATGI